jgi:hypothetical protein
MTDVFRIYTEDVNREAIAQLCADKLPAFTLIPARGIWQGTQENSLIIEVIGTPSDRIAVEYAAKAIKHANKQDAVLVTHSTLNGVLL